MIVRKATAADVPRILEIYAPYIRQTCITFEYLVPSDEDFLRRFEDISSLYPYFVACEENSGKVTGYAYASRAFERAAFAWSADLSVYVDMDERGKGIGRMLVAAVEKELEQMGVCTVCALITGENTKSVVFHKKLGYSHSGTLTAIGYKMGRWHDLHFYTKRICDTPCPPDIPGITQRFETEGE